MDKPTIRDYRFENTLDFCNYPDWSRRKLRDEVELNIKRSVLQPMYESTGYLEFVRDIVVHLFTTINDEDTKIYPADIEKMFLKSYFIAVAPGMKHDGYYRHSLDCTTEELTAITDKKKMEEEVIATVSSIHQHDANRRRTSMATEST